MSTEAFLGEVELYGFNFAPRGFVFCYGQNETVQSNTALFSLLSTFYGGDGRVTFGIPDLRGRVAVGNGNGPGLTPRPLGTRYGNETHVLSLAEMPKHNHLAVATAKPGAVITGQAKVNAFNGTGDTNDAENAYWATGGIPSGFNVDPIQKAYSTTANTTMASGAVQVGFDASDVPAPDVITGNTGAGQYFFINQPSSVMTYAISTDGIYPPRS
ncbi:tail fiber protein [Vibrio sp. IRLE0018]|uniref:phage tail protein n=1 Tax=Vibrio TaxID=662 RepID=UPI001592C8A5|nr:MULTISPECIES: tail fiber protein [Vibrio]MCF8778057.1 tail fiber protein [Vibrio floridensis]